MLKNRGSMAVLSLNPEQRVLFKNLLIKYGFLIRPILSDPEFRNEFCYKSVDKDTGIVSTKVIKYGSVLFMIYHDPDLQYFYKNNKDMLCTRLMDNALSISEGIVAPSPVPASLRLEAIKFMLKILDPTMFKEKTINFNACFNNSKNERQTVKEWLESERDGSGFID